MAISTLSPARWIMSRRPGGTVTEGEAEDLVLTARAVGRICAVNYGYTGYALVRHMRAMVARGDLGKIRLVVAEFAHGHHANAADANNLRVPCAFKWFKAA